MAVKGQSALRQPGACSGLADTNSNTNTNINNIQGARGALAQRMSLSQLDHSPLLSKLIQRGPTMRTQQHMREYLTAVESGQIGSLTVVLQLHHFTRERGKGSASGERAWKRRATNRVSHVVITPIEVITSDAGGKAAFGRGRGSTASWSTYLAKYTRV